MATPSPTHIFHITDVTNLPTIIRSGGLLSDLQLQVPQPAGAGSAYTGIGYSHIKLRRMQEIVVSCCSNRPTVGAFVPFYYCPRSVMLYTINMGNTGRPKGCQTSILHLVTTVQTVLPSARDWAISDGNAGAYHTSFFKSLTALDDLNWAAINATQWAGKTHQKAAEFLVLDMVPWTAIQMIGCHNMEIANQVKQIIAHAGAAHRPTTTVTPAWYYP